MKQRYILSAFFFSIILYPWLLSAQMAGELREPPYIEVTGVAEQEVVPDEIYVSIIIREKYSNKEKVSIQVQEEKLKGQLKSLGIDMSNLFLADANADLITIRWKNTGLLTQKEYTLKLSNATQVGQVFQQLDKLDITDAGIQRVHYSKLDSLKKEVKIAAIKAAKAKADYLLAAIGEQTGKALIEQETDNPVYPMVGAAFQNARTMDDPNASEIAVATTGTDLQFRKIKVEARIYVKFSIK